MLLPATIVTPPSEPIISLADAKAELRMEVDDATGLPAGLLEAHLAAAIALVESVTGSKIGQQTIEVRGRCFADFERLTWPPVASVAGVTYLDIAGAVQTLAAERYELFGAGLIAGVRAKAGQTLPGVRAVEDAVRMQLLVGYTDADLPPVVKAAVMLKVRGLIDGDDVDASIMALLVNHRAY